MFNKKLQEALQSNNIVGNREQIEQDNGIFRRTSKSDKSEDII